MPIINSVAAMQDEVAAWRRDIHENPELLYDVHRTAGVVADKLKAFGCDEVVPGIGRTGVVGVIKGRKAGSGKVIGMRADMDALPMTETTGLPYASKTAGRMHACGHDGHTAMLLGAAKYLCQTRNFDGTRGGHLPARRGRRRRRQGDGGRRDDGPLEHPGGLRHAQHAGHPRRPVRHSPGPAAGGERRHRHRDHRQGRPRGAAAPVHRPGPGRLPHRHRAAFDRLAQRRSAAVGRHLDLHVPRRRGAQRDPGDGAAAGHRPLAHAAKCATSSSGAWSRWPRRRRGCTAPPPRRPTSATIR